MKRRHSARLAFAGLCASFGIFVAACTTPPPLPPPVTVSFAATTITVNEATDGGCLPIVGCIDDEPYLYQIYFRVKIGEPNSAVVTVKEGAEISPSLEKGESQSLTGAEQAAFNLFNVQPLDVVSALNPANKLEVFGTYTWAAEADVINTLDGGAEAIRGGMQNALNATLAGSTLPQGDPGGLVSNIVNLLFDNAGAAFKLILANLPCAGLCDDVLGGAVYVGIGVNGTLGQLVDAALVNVPAPSLPLAGNNKIPPDIQGGGYFTLTGTRYFTQTFVGAGGSHTYTFGVG